MTTSRRRSAPRNGPLVTLPYTIECNDIPVMIIQHHNSDYLLQMVKDQFDRLYAESANRAKFVALAIHPYISGQPHRIKYLEQIYDYVNRHEGVLHWNGEQISIGTGALPRIGPPRSVGPPPTTKTRELHREEIGGCMASTQFCAPLPARRRCSAC